MTSIMKLLFHHLSVMGSACLCGFLMCTAVCNFICLTHFFFFFYHHSQVETIHPACALVAEHMKAQEQCIRTQRQEAHNSNNITGELTHLNYFIPYYFTSIYVLNIYPFAHWLIRHFLRWTGFKRISVFQIGWRAEN